MFERFEALLAERNVKMSDVSRDAGIPYSTFTDWKAGRYTPKVDKLQKIADYFGVPIEAFLGSSDAPPPRPARALSADEDELLRGFAAASSDDRDTMLFLARRAILKKTEESAKSGHSRRAESRRSA